MSESLTLQDAVAAEVRAEIARQQKTGTAVAEAMGVSHMYLSRRLNRKTPFDLRDLDRLARALGVPVSTFLPVERAA